jgi:hypothetical protein
MALTDPSFPFLEVFESELAAFVDGWPARLQTLMRGGSPVDDFEGARVIGFHAEARTKAAWASLLPRLTTVTGLWAKTTVDEVLLSAICKMHALTHLHVERIATESCAPLQELRNLTHLAIGGSTRLRTLAPITTLPAIRAVSLIGGFPHVERLDDFAAATNLEGFTLSGSLGGRTHTYDSLDAISSLQRLRYFGIAGIRLRNGGLRPLAALHALEYLFIHLRDLKHWPASEYEELHESLPNLKHDLIRLAATDRDFQDQHGIK